jgi:co-chaperonin GroES (HSP10)
MPTRVENFYSEITEEQACGLEKFPVEDFQPCKGHVLVILPPEIIESDKGIVLPDTMHKRPNYGRVATVPLIERDELDTQDPSCPCKPGQWVIFQPGTGQLLPFAGRKDLLLLDYTDDMAEILGVFDEAPGEVPSRIIFKGSSGEEGLECLNCGFFIPSTSPEKIKEALKADFCPDCKVTSEGFWRGQESELTEASK